MEWVRSSEVWPFFDGWCASRNVDHWQLPWDRWLNLVYYFGIRNASQEERQKFDDVIAQRTTEWHLAKAAPAIREARKNPQPVNGRERRMPPKPAGWGTDTANTFNSKAAIKTLTAAGVSGKARRK
jgi:hypothetical protein